MSTPASGFFESIATDFIVPRTLGGIIGMGPVQNNGRLSISDTTPSISATTGALTVAGGIGVGEKVYTTDGVLTPGRIIVTNTTPSTTPLTGAVVVRGGIGTEDSVYSAGTVAADALSAATDVHSSGTMRADGASTLAGGARFGVTGTPPLYAPSLLGIYETGTFSLIFAMFTVPATVPCIFAWIGRQVTIALQHPIQGICTAAGPISGGDIPGRIRPFPQSADTLVRVNIQPTAPPGPTIETTAIVTADTATNTVVINRIPAIPSFAIGDIVSISPFNITYITS